LSLHALLFVSWPRHKTVERTLEQIPVSLLPAPLPTPSPLPEAPRREPKAQRPPAPRSRAARVDKKTAGVPNLSQPSPPAEKSEAPPEPPQETKIAKRTEKIGKDEVEIPVTPRRLPTLKELLPSPTWSPSRKGASQEGPIRLDTREPKYLSYFEHIKSAIEVVWDYPENALKRGIEGKLLLEFTIQANGALDGLRLVRTSGFADLDEEAIRAVRAAAPFRPIPSHIGKQRLDIIASFEYHDSRLHYDFGNR
ncbi:MAG: TonB family protein, partial [Candidatus Binatia bacterium]